jgi:hypothetical protein
LLALQAEAYHEVAPYPLDVLGAESEGMIGYLIEKELRNRLPGRDVVTLLTQVEVAADDPAFGSRQLTSLSTAAASAARGPRRRARLGGSAPRPRRQRARSRDAISSWCGSASSSQRRRRHLWCATGAAGTTAPLW